MCWKDTDLDRKEESRSIGDSPLETNNTTPIRERNCRGSSVAEVQQIQQSRPVTVCISLNAFVFALNCLITYRGYPQNIDLCWKEPLAPLRDSRGSEGTCGDKSSNSRQFPMS